MSPALVAAWSGREVFHWRVLAASICPAFLDSEDHPAPKSTFSLVLHLLVSL